MPGQAFTPLDRDQRQHILRIAHRGASAYAPENSLLAFEKAAEMQSDMVEVDIRVTSDSVPVVAHDESLRRVYGVDQALADLTLAQLEQAIPAGQHPVPTFEQVAEICAALKLGLYLDIKTVDRAAVVSVIESLTRHGLLPYTIFGSFRPDFVANLKAANSELNTSILFGSVNLDPVLLASALQADYVHPCWENAAPEPHKLLTPAWMAQVRAAGLGVVCWHEERPAELSALNEIGVDGICSDTPDVLAALTPNAQS